MKQKPIKAVKAWAVVDNADGEIVVAYRWRMSALAEKAICVNARVIPVRIVPIKRKARGKGKVRK